jgi:hypothetical protein
MAANGEAAATPAGTFTGPRPGRLKPCGFFVAKIPRGAAAGCGGRAPLVVAGSVLQLGMDFCQVDLARWHLVGRIVEIIAEQLEILLVDFPYEMP